MLRDRLIPALQREFAGWEMQLDTPPRPIATFPAAQPAVGRVLIYDDGNEATVWIERIAHGHFHPDDATLSQAQRDEQVTEDVVDFLRALLGDRVLLYRTAAGGMGGWQRLDLDHATPVPLGLSQSLRYYLWSRPLECHERRSGEG